LADNLNLTRGMMFHYLRGFSKIPVGNYEKMCLLAQVPLSAYSTLDIKNKTEPINLSNLNEEKLSELLGILAGDGHLSKINYEVSVTCDIVRDDDYILNYVAPLFRDLFNVNAKIKRQPNGGAIRCVVNSKLLSEYLVKVFDIPLGKKKGKLHIPPQIFKNKNLLKFYLRGLFDTDGSFYIRRKKNMVINIASRDVQHLDEVKRSFSKLGYTPSVGGKNLFIYNQNQIIRFFNEIGSSNSKHQQKYDNFIK
jgi:intein/homing endonuclease